MATASVHRYSNLVRSPILVLLLLGGCASGMEGKWPTLAPRPGEISADGAPPPVCPGCGTDTPATPPVAVAAPLPLPADVDRRLAAMAAAIAEVEAKAPAQARRAGAAAAAARADAGRSGDAEVERSRFEALFLPLAIEERRLEVLSDDIAGRTGADAVLRHIAELRARLAALDALRGSIGE